jgi:cobalt transporter subunit CbtA
MTLFRNVVFVAAIAGLLAGIVMTAMQAYATVPLILQAETFENSEAAPAHDHSAPADAATSSEAAAPTAAHSHDHGEEAWAPADGFERYAYTAAANIVTAIGFALVLVAVSEAFGGIVSWRQGLVDQHCRSNGHRPGAHRLSQFGAACSCRPRFDRCAACHRRTAAGKP